jgi:hypothetical protein
LRKTWLFSPAGQRDQVDGGKKPEQVMGKEKQDNTGKDMDKGAEHKKRIARDSDRTIKKELKVEKPDVRRGKGRTS